MGDQTTLMQKALWAIAILLVLLYALIPVAWITALSLKPPAEVGDGKFFIGQSYSLDNYDAIFSENSCGMNLPSPTCSGGLSDSDVIHSTGISA